MARRTGRSDWPVDPAAAMRAMRLCRDAMLEVCKTVRPMGTAYHGASMVIAAIDAFATLLTKERFYFGIEGSGATEGQRADAAEKVAREAGEKPWDGGSTPPDL